MEEISKRPYKRWSEEEISYFKENYQKSRTEEIAKKLERTPYSIQAKARKLKLIKGRLKFRLPLPPKERLISALDHRNVSDIAKNSFGVCEETLKKWAKHYGITIHRSKLKRAINNERVVAKIKEMYLSKHAKEISREIGLCERYVVEIINRKFYPKKEKRKHTPKLIPIKEFLDIEGDYFRCRHLGCDYIIKVGEKDCILVEEKSSNYRSNVWRGICELLLAEKLIKRYFGLNVVKKIITFRYERKEKRGSTYDTSRYLQELNVELKKLEPHPKKE